MSKKRVLVSALLVLIFLLGFLIDSVIHPRMNFTYYEPSYLPDGISIKQKRIQIASGDKSASQNFRTEDWVYDITEFKADTDIGSANQDYSPTSKQPTCELRTTPKHQQYRVCHWIDYGKIDVTEVKFIKQGTFIWAAMPIEVGKQLPLTQIDTFIDSFHKSSTWGFPVIRSNGP